MKHFLLFYEVSADYLERRPQFRAEHLKLAWEAQERGEILIAGVRPEHFEDAHLLDDSRRAGGLVFAAHIDVIEWLGSEQYAYIPFEAPEEVRRPLEELATELDSEQIRTQLVVSLAAESRVRQGVSA